jgi:hypothetical protein
MLERLRIARSVWTLLCCLLPMCAWFACQSTPSDSTETGNPPVLDADAISWLRYGADAEVLGQPGAVKPGGSLVEVLVDGKVVGSAISNENGSFEMTAVGAGEGNFVIRAKNGRHSDTLKSSDIQQQDATSVSQDPLTGADAAPEVDAASELDAATEVDTASTDAGAGEAPPTSTAPDAAAPAAPDAASPVLDATTATTTPTPDTASAVVADAQSSTDAQSTSDAAVVNSAACMDLHQQVEARLDEVMLEASVGCRTAQDCVLVPLGSSCYQTCEFPVVGSKAANVSAAVAQIEQQICAPHNAMSCTLGGHPCDLPPTTSVVCVQSECALSGIPEIVDAGRI